MAKFFDDIGKDSGDLLSKDFPSAGLAKINIEAKNDSGVTIAAAGRRFIKGKDALVEGTFEPTVDWSAHNLELKGNFSTSAEYSGTATLKDVGSKGSKLSAGLSHKSSGAVANAGASFKNEHVAVKVNGGIPFSDGALTSDASLVAAYEKKIFGGASVNYTHSTEKVPAALFWGIKVGFDQPDFQGHAHVRSAIKDKKDQLIIGAGWFHKINDNLKIGASAAFDTKQVQGPSVTIGKDYKFDGNSSVKAKFSFQAHADSSKPADLRLGFGVKQLFTKNASVTLGADLNARNLAGQNSGEDHSFGVELKFF